MFVQATDADGNALGGIRNPMLDAPLATHTGWSLRASGYGEGDLFTISLRAAGYTQYLRRPPVYVPYQRLSVEERGGLSFDQHGYTR